MNGIQTQEVFEGPNDTYLREYKVKLDGKWFKVTWTECPVLDGRFACSSNIHKWDRVGMSNEFKIEPTEDPERELPGVVQQFLHRHKETGKSTGLLMVPDENLDREYPGHKWGWVNEPFRDEHVC